MDEADHHFGGRAGARASLSAWHDDDNHDNDNNDNNDNNNARAPQVA
jgi:hypothetical protein